MREVDIYKVKVAEVTRLLEQSEPVVGEGWEEAYRAEMIEIEKLLDQVEEIIRVKETVENELLQAVRERNERLNFGEQSPESGKIYNLIAGMNEKYNWLEGRLERLEEAKRKTTGWVRAVRQKDQNSLYKAEQKFISDLRKAGILEKLEGGLLDFFTNALHDLFLAMEEAVGEAFENDAERLEHLEAFEKEFNLGYKALREEYENLWDQLNPSDIAWAMPITPYRAEMPEGVNRANLTRAGDLGEGGFGDAFLLVNSGPQGPPTMAVKMLKEKQGMNEEETLQIKQEQRLELQKEVMIYEKIGEHPNIMKCYGIQKIGDREGMVMEALEGGSAMENLDLLNEKYKAGEVNDTEYMGFLQHTMRGLMQGLAHMEKAGFAHLDVKFPNLMMGKDGEIKIIDPGISEEIGLTADVIPDNPIYKDPVLSRDVIAQPYNDVFSAGLALYEMKQAHEHKPDKQRERDAELFLFGETSAKFAFKVDRAGEQFIADAANRVFSIMPEEAKAELKRRIEEAQGILRDQLEEYEATWESTKDFFAKQVNSEEELLAEYAKNRKPIFDTYQEVIGSIRAEFFKEYGSPMENAYMSFMNQIMHPDPNQRPSAAEILDHPFLSDSLVKDESAIKNIFWKLQPDLHPDNRQPAVPGTPIPLEDPEVQPMEISIEERQDIKVKVETELQNPGEMRDYMEGTFMDLMENFQRDMAQWKREARDFTSELAITGIMDTYSKMPHPRLFANSISKSQTEFLQDVSANLNQQLHYADTGITYFDNLNRPLDQSEIDTQQSLRNAKALLENMIVEQEKLQLFDQNWRKAFGKLPDGRTRVYAPNEALKVNLDPQAQTLLSNAIQPFLRKGKTNNKELRKQAARLAYKTLKEDDVSYMSDQLARSLALVRRIKKSPYVNQLLNKKSRKTWPGWSVGKIEHLYKHLTSCEMAIQEMDEQGEIAGDEEIVYTFLSELREKLVIDLIPRFEAQNEMLNYMDANYEQYLSTL